MKELTQNNSSLPQTVYKPSEIIGIFNSILAKQSVNAQVIYMKGIYLANPKQGNWSYCYDTLRDEDSQEELTLQITPQQRENLKNGNLVNVGGVLNRSVSNKGYIQITLKVSRIEIVKEQAIDEAEIRRMELRQKKATIGFKNIDSILEGLLFTDKRPKIALVFAATSITLSDFQAGINAAKSAIDFDEHRANFGNATELITLLKKLDLSGYDVIAIVRGGGGGIENLDELSVLETIVSLATPIVGAIGHVEEKLFIKQIVDKAAPTPNGLGQYFSEMVETVSEKKTRSRAVLTEKIKKEFKDQLEASQKQNKELQDKLKSLTETQKKAAEAQQEATKKHNEQVQAAQKQNKELQDKLKELTEAQKEATKKHNEQMETAQKQNQSLQGQLKTLTESQTKIQEQHKIQQEELNKNLHKIQETNSQLQISLQQITSKNADSIKELNLAKERAKDLENQLKELKEKKTKSNSSLIVILVFIILIFLILIFIK